MTEELKSKAEKMYVESDLTLRQVGERLGINLGMIRKYSCRNGWVGKRNEWRAQHGINAAPKVCTKNVDWASVRMDYLLGGMTNKALAAKYGINVSSLYRNKKKEGWCEIPASASIACDRCSTAVDDASNVREPLSSLANRYITGLESLNQLAKAQRLSLDSLTKMATAEHWHERRREFRKRKAEQIVRLKAEADEAFRCRLAAANDHVIEKLETLLDSDSLRPNDLEHLSKTLLNAEETDHRISCRIRPAEQAMIDVALKRVECAERKNEPAPMPEIKWSDECLACAE